MLPSDSDYYEVLGVAANESKDNLRKAYRRRIRECHPDRGGDAVEAALVNEAWAVLSDETRRAAYDSVMDGLGRHAPKRFARCAFCGHYRPMFVEADARCMRCDSPLQSAERPRYERNDQRGVARILASEPVVCRIGWPETSEFSADLVDVSLTGVGLESQRRLLTGDVVRLSNEHIDAVAAIVSVVPAGHSPERYRAGAMFLTLIRHQIVGGLVSRRV